MQVHPLFQDPSVFLPVGVFHQMFISLYSLSALMSVVCKLIFVGVFPSSPPASPAGQDGASTEGADAGEAETRAAQG